jgi:hypothetical protein
MAENKTQRTTASVAAYLAAIPDPSRQRDAKALAAVIRKASGCLDTRVLARLIKLSHKGNRRAR